jgi:predicted Zn-dependent peptidase
VTSAVTATLLPRPEVGAPAAWRFPAIAEHRLSNGTRVLAVHLPGKLVASVVALVDLPVEADPVGQEGLASLAARCLRVGTASYDEGSFAEALERRGASFQAFAGYDGLQAILDVPVSRLAEALPLLGEAVMQPTFPSNEVDRVVRQRLAEITQQLANPAARSQLEFGELLHEEGTRHGKPVGGSTESVTGINAALMAETYAARAAGSTTTLIVAGDLSGVDVVAQLDAVFGGWTTSNEPFAPSTPGYRTRRAVIVDRPGSVQTQLAIGHGAFGRSHADWPAMTLAGYALGGTLTSRIDAVLREEKGYTYGMRGSFTANRTAAHYLIAGSVDTENTGPALSDLNTVLTTARSEGLRQEELDAGKQYLVGVSPMRWETPTAVAQNVAMLVGNELPLTWTDSYLERMRTATLDEVNAAQAAHVRPDDLVVVAVGEAAAISGPLEDLGYTPEVITA